MVISNPPKRKNDERVEILPHHLTILSVVFLISASTIGSLLWNASRTPTDFPSAHLLYWQNYQGISLDLITGERFAVDERQSDTWLKHSPDGKWAARWSRDNECCDWSLHIYEGAAGPNRGFITRRGGGDLVSWMPDGEWFAFSALPEDSSHSSNDSDEELYLANIDTHEIKQLTNNDVMDSGPSISPDGTKMAYTSANNGRNHLYIIDLASGESRLLTSDVQGYNAVWSPDGAWLAFMSKCGSKDPMNPTHGSLWLIRADGTGMQKIAERVNFVEPSWRP